jgi:hypothetical protein
MKRLCVLLIVSLLAANAFGIEDWVDRDPTDVYTAGGHAGNPILKGDLVTTSDMGQVLTTSSDTGGPTMQFVFPRAVTQIGNISLANFNALNPAVTTFGTAAEATTCHADVWYQREIVNDITWNLGSKTINMTGSTEVFYNQAAAAWNGAYGRDPGRWWQNLDNADASGTAPVACYDYALSGEQVSAIGFVMLASACDKWGWFPNHGIDATVVATLDDASTITANTGNLINNPVSAYQDFFVGLDAVAAGASYITNLTIYTNNVLYPYDRIGVDNLGIVPEPVTIALLGLGGLFLRRRK